MYIQRVEMFEMRFHRPWHAMLLPSIPFLTGFAIVKYFGWDDMASRILAVYIWTFSLIYGAGIMYQSVLITGYLTAVDKPDPNPAKVETDPQGWKPLPNLNQLNQVVAPVKFDMERQFAKTLLVMRDYKPNDAAVDLREKTWIRPNKFKTRDEYVNMLHAWVNHGVVARKSAAKNSPYVVRRWDAVELIADGNPIR